MSVSPAAARGLYRSLLRAARGFTNYNFREYALRHVQEDFRAASDLSTPAEITHAYKQGRMHLDVLRRQAMISSMFPQEKHAMEV
mmetsp:Transcript_36570/g.72858  ORF Transcript_36570/g.72858 Transcript_36570/m.72858 type:complete len:85 (+) Transcript_36570:21-275(+)|eukprot:CAMPEP_0174716242 /NCGR_PEP_ID=MMETSP1094-20130205/23381_1 /TAXON_ID=156173 /ORGANISM="Chrysochromulina brevifilum, Strain UTEX LB 985" /LENGTH=84 /DNA_ID=CAMNT_0015915941 /DNA_START=21 /DNA_END=275 /DNA_ORIENTATION=+